MLLLPLLAVVVASEDVKLESTVCDGLVFQNVYYDKQILVRNLGRPYNLVMHKFTGTLFFSHTTRRGGNVDFAILACEINKRQSKCHKINVDGGYAIAYDSGNDDMYFGGHRGIFKYNFLTKSAEYFSEMDKSIWGIFIRRNFYYIEYPTQELFVYHNENFVPVAEAINMEVDNFFMSRKGEVYFSNKTALYKVENKSKYVNVLDDNIVVRQIIDDSYGDMYFCGADGVYIEEKPYRRIKKVAHIKKAFGMTFDERDNVIYSDEGTIYRLLPSNKSDICTEVIFENI